MQVLCYLDESGWGDALFHAVSGLGGEATRFRPEDAEEVASRHNRNGLAFVRMHHGAAVASSGMPERRERDKRVMQTLIGREVRTIPSALGAWLYDDKAAQSAVYAGWTPQTFILTNRRAAERAAHMLGYPFVSKASRGAGSHNVRLVRNAREAEAEIAAAFEGQGLKLRYDQRQTGYLLWQEFCPDNAYDYRVVILGGYLMMLKRFNRADPATPFASGSGKLEAITAPSGEQFGVLETASAFFKHFGYRFAAIDLVYDLSRWVVLESSSSWTMGGYTGCAMLDADTFAPTGRTGADVWQVLAEQVLSGELEDRPMANHLPPPLSTVFSRWCAGERTDGGW